MKILILSATEWNNNNSFGNSFSSIFENIENIEIANIYCKNGIPDNNIVKRYFQITEKSLMGNLRNKENPAGLEIRSEHSSVMSEKETNVYNYARKKRWMILFWARDFIWKIGRWKSEALNQFISDFDPDILFMPIYYSSYLNDMACYIKKYTNKPMVGYISDDNYTLRQFSLSPLYWIDRLYKRRKVKNTVDLCEYLYVISDIQKQEYEKCFNKQCKLLFKGAKFDTMPEYASKNKYIKFVYTGNIGAGRYKQLATIGQAISKINKNKKIAELDIYTLTPMSATMKKALDIPNSINMKGSISSEQVKEVQAEADVLVHVESFDLKSRLAVHQSFSTKLVDYMEMAKCIFAAGPFDVASIDYLIKNDAAVTATNKKEIEARLNELINDSDLMKAYGVKAWECGKRNHQIDTIQSGLYKDLKGLVDK